MNQLVRIDTSSLPALVTAAGDRAEIRFLEFFAGQIRNPHTRRAYSRAVAEFLTWCAGTGVPSIAGVQRLHVATWIEGQTRTVSAPTVKQQLAAIRHLFDWLVQPAPFKRRSDGTDYLKVYHRKRLADGGDDTVENAEARRPNCHRKAHYT